MVPETTVIMLLFANSVSANTDNSVKVAMGNIQRLNTRAGLEDYYKAADIDVEFIYLPNERAIQAAVSGQYDALDLRVDTLDEEETLIRIDVPGFVMNVYLLSINDDFYQGVDEVKDKTLVSH